MAVGDRLESREAKPAIPKRPNRVQTQPIDSRRPGKIVAGSGSRLRLGENSTGRDALSWNRLNG